MRPLPSTLALLAGIALIASCSEDDTKKVAPDAGTSGTAGTGGSSGRGGSGGSSGRGGSAGSGGSAGTAGTGGTSGSAGTGGSSGTGGSAGTADASDAEPPLVCAPVPDGGSDAGADAEAGTGEWRDWAARRCVPCPAQDIDCEHLVGGSTHYDPATRILTFTLAPGIAEVVSGEVSLNWRVMDDGGGSSGNATATLVVDKNTLTADLSSAEVPVGVYELYGIEVDLTDACGARDTTTSFEWSNSLEPDGGTVINIHCEQPVLPIR